MRNNFQLQILNFQKKGINNENSGFSLVELIIYMGIFAIVIAILSTVFSTILDTQLQSQSLSSVQQNGRYILARLMYDVTRASAIVTPASIGTTGSLLQLTIGGTDYQYTVDGTKTLTIKNMTTSATDNLSNYDTDVNSFQVTRLGNSGGKNAIQLNLTLTSRTKLVSGSESATFQTTIGTR